MKLRDSCRKYLDDHPRIQRTARWIKKYRHRLVSAFVVFAHVLGALTSVRAIMEVRTAQGAVAWAISLNTIPYVAVPAYWVFGRSDFKGYVSSRQTNIAELDAFWTEFEEVLLERNLVVDQGRPENFVTEELARMPATVGNDAELLIDGEATYKSIFEGISRAKEYILVQFYIIQDDPVGHALRDTLLERARAGVTCYFLYDEIGSKLPPSFTDPLLEAGVQLRPFNTTQGEANRFQINFRNHRKVVIIDGLEAWVGGLNVGEEYKGLDPDVGNWRDTHLRMAGPIVQCVQVSFAEDWHWATQEILRDLNWDPQPAPSGASRAMACLPSGPVDKLETCTLFFLHAINTAEKRLWIASPYFVPDEQFISALQLAALRGVDVRVIIPDKSDSGLIDLSAWTYIPELQKVGIKVYRHENGFMHQKVTVIDDEYCTVGTANFDNRSFRLNFEITMGFRDVDFTTQVATMLEADMADSRLVAGGEYEDKSGWFRFWSRAARLTAPIQ